MFEIWLVRDDEDYENIALYKDGVLFSGCYANRKVKKVLTLGKNLPYRLVNKIVDDVRTELEFSPGLRG